MTKAALAAAGLAAALALAACGGGSAREGLDWTPCGGRLECATLRVPLDYARPDRRQIELALVRLPAAKPGRRLGSLLLNPGGPGQSGTAVVRTAQLLPFDPEIFERFDLVGFDPRGVGKSTPIRCAGDRETLVGLDPFPDGRAEAEALGEADAALTKRCRTKYPGLLPRLGTVSAARDLDRIRAALGDNRLTFVGFSYGTRLGSVYAHLFPGRVRALVLDGGVHPTEPPGALARDGAAAVEEALHRFFADCRRRVDCPVRDDPEAAWREAARIAEREDVVPAGFFYRGAALLLLDAHQGWPLLGRALAALPTGDALLFRAVVRLAYSGANANALESGVAVLCADERDRLTLDEYLSLERELAARYPLLGFAALSGCSRGWPAAAEPVPAVRAAGAPPILVVGTRHDPATPYSWSVALARALESGVLVTYEGDGHTAFTSGNECVGEIVTRYLVDLAVPRDGVTCRP